MDTSQSLAGRVAVVTGAGAGLGRAEALGLAAAGAAVVVNDVGAAAHEVVEEITAAGGRAVASVGDVSTWSTGEAIMRAATEQLGGLDVVVNNAGLTRDRMIFNMSESEWDQVIAVHLKGHFVLTRMAAAYWRDRSKEVGGPVGGRLVNTASEAALNGGPGQPNYAAAKAGIIALTVSAARACERYGVTANAICPRARTAMTADVFGEAPADGIDPLSTDQVTPLVTYLASPAAAGINGQVFVVHSGRIALLAPARVEATFASTGVWSVQEVGRRLGDHFADRDPARTFSAKAEMDRV